MGSPSLRPLKFCWLLSGLAALALIGPPLGAQPAPPEAKELARSDRLLDEFEAATRTLAVHYALDAQEDEFKAQWWILSRKTAAKTGPAMIHALMKRSRSWQGEEVILYIPLVAFLERKATMKLLEDYRHSKVETHRIYAGDLIAELGAADIKEGFRKFSRGSNDTVDEKR